MSFDEIAEELGVEKIKTLGDCYMACCGMTFCEDYCESLFGSAKGRERETNVLQGSLSQTLTMP